jgi:hypothetical protein
MKNPSGIFHRSDAYNRGVSRTWILTGSPENHAATRDNDHFIGARA